MKSTDDAEMKRICFFFQAEDGIRDGHVTWSSDVCSSDLSSISSDGKEEILSAKQHNTLADSPPEEQRNRVRDAQAQQGEPMPSLQGSSSSMSSIDRFSAARSEERRVGKDFSTQQMAGDAK